MGNGPGEFRWRLRLASSPLRVLPDFIVSGEAKCGTTSLYRYLTQHPDVYPADAKEPNNFIRYPASRLFCRLHYPLRVVKVVRERVLAKRFATGEASAEYLSKTDVPASVAAVVPRVRLIVLLRNPVARAVSDYEMLTAAGIIRDEFRTLVEETIAWLGRPRLAAVVHAAAEREHSPLRCVVRGLYARNIRNWMRYFPREQFLFIKSEEFFADPQRILDEVCDFLTLPPFRFREFPVFRPGRHDPSALDAELLEKLGAFYRPHNEELYRLLGRDLGWERETDELLRADRVGAL